MKDNKEEILRHIQGERWKRAYELMVETFQHDIYRYCFRRLGKKDAEDVAQEVFLAAWKALPKIRLAYGADSIAPWLYRIAKRRVIDAIVVQKRERMLFSGTSSPAEDESSDTTTADADTMIPDTLVLQRALGQLSEEDREILSYWAVGFKSTEIAGFLNTTPEAVRTRISRALKKLREIVNNGRKNRKEDC